ncbi:MAG: hypothetical protein COY38_02640 [Candidatus Aenigmarchaeota archaeon CG_4_10_14_0_8_um_filter_37_24]|nr:hypothetical protein [Candidatus Aenigmarchaeota archaeon]OIN85285.1 MAG: hypothetical protein AUJ50_05450 [Candidatus Aenigmarchaeota archaeon CG1_02_38_14]PIX51130.1 MAG: hypothetical protein COZ52_00555 [Candidatus Aenigmarchaeota archaeon CG_4_8_14_3_um_filter_37_24]PIY35886.1 MAG: hypothetical protein COZ04_01970 [Candidatus Aenigmarchaeota archaeon CG_4_10_14_3_um_filter_37_21]PIZ35268.1 MAG: hypothetical protein COY38_02640 [Candidatus Aenigmarchaeota archaeon CG_4_10_14_0_8_um_filter
MQKKCSKCGKPIKEVGRLVKVDWLGRRAPLCSKCRNEVKKKPKSRFFVDELFRRLRRESTNGPKKKKTKKK